MDATQNPMSNEEFDALTPEQQEALLAEQSDPVLQEKQEEVVEKMEEQKKGRIDLAPVAASGRSKGNRLDPATSYEIIASPKNTKLTPQAQLVLHIINNNTSDQKPTLNEPELAKLLEEAKAAKVLETKQPAWRIFQFYRPTLIACGAIRKYQNGVVQLAA
jgi:hypothetical protein